jgi:hypothetical protein
MSSREFAEWLAYNATVEPIGETRADIRVSMALTWLSRLLGAKKVDPWWFMPFLEAPEAEALGDLGAGVMSREQLHSRPAGIGPELRRAARERKRAGELYSEIRSWAMLEQIKAKRGNDVNSK